MTDYLPNDATIEDACNWLQAKTGEKWTLPRLIEHNLIPHIWLANDPRYPAIFGDKPEGYQTRMVYRGDLNRLAADGTCCLTMFLSHDGKFGKVEPSASVPLSELRFKRDDIRRVADAVVAGRPAPSADVAPVMAVEPAIADTAAEPCWNLKPNPPKFQGYREPLYSFLKLERERRNPRPKAMDVLEYWKKVPPKGIVVNDEKREPYLKYELSLGVWKEANLKAIDASIKNLIVDE